MTVLTDGSRFQVPARFCGPPESANGGYFCGLVAAAIGERVTVRLHRPVPLDSELLVDRPPDGEGWRVRDDAVVLASAWHAELDLVPPAPPPYVEALDATIHEPPVDLHPCPGCFVCGPARARGDGLRLHAGPVPGHDYVATAWLQSTEFALADGKVAPEFIAAALDCPGYQSLQAGRDLWLLGEYTVQIDRRVHAAEPCVIVGWTIGGSGRKRVVGTALYDEDGECCARAQGTWIQPRPAGGTGA
jgi:hypothetical protein